MKNFLKLMAIGGTMLFTAIEGFSQGPYGYYNDALLFSQTTLGGSARVQGMGGVQMALGGDISNVMSNPAGLGLYNRSEISFTPAFNFNGTATRYLGTTTDAFTTRASFNNIGMVFYRGRDPQLSGNWRGGSFGISYNRTNNFNSEFQYAARDPETSIIDYFLDASTGIPESQILNAGLIGSAYATYIINPIEDDLYDSFIIGYPSRQSESVVTRGAQSQWTFSYGGNYADKVYFGLGLGFTSLRYRQESTYSETFVGQPLNNLQAVENLSFNGAGINGTLGVIVRPTDQFRFGVGLITPTFYALNEESFASMSAVYNNYYYEEIDEVLGNEFDETPIQVFDLNLSTPMRLNGGIAYFFDKNGFFSADIEYVNFRSARLNASGFSMSEDNQVIRDIYRPVVNVKVGGEYRIDMFRLRGGAGYYGDPHEDTSGINRSRLMLSLGAGIRLPTFYFDLAFVNSRFNNMYVPYESSVGVQPIAEVSNNRVSGILTFGFNF